MTDQNPAIVATALARSFGETQAVRGVDLRVEPGEIYGFLGPNGAGKSTVVRMLCTLLRPSAGSATVAGGLDLVDDRLRCGARSRRPRWPAALTSSTTDCAVGRGHVGHDDLRAFRGEHSRRDAAHAARAAGDDR